ncbi:stonustoxin subunit beta-like isoform X2 [Plectropomus leopardus]|uniref:stonustoxin subunit beta-like isoform X2 n=1 Tax=Plectropomus leopardus TaxID=160734 RepID=UPI001C4B67D7|nr:stonustoxin subunit beta-like isoform X2 [Plectropomus leopardus]
MASDKMVVAALGRPFTLGMLYDARKDALIPGLTLWDEKTLQENKVENSQHSSKLDISSSDSIDSKASHLDVESSLKASFLSGMIEVEGSAKYLNDKKRFKNQSRVTFRYKATTIFRELSMLHLLKMNPEQTNIMRKSSATHVVTAILYGANAFFVFDSEKLETSKVQDIQGGMEAMIKKIPTFVNIEGKSEIKLNDEEKALTKEFSCKFYGDFILENNPTTFEEAVQTYAKLPQLLGETGENAVPVKVWLMPLKNMDSEAPELTKGISIGLVRKMEDALEDLREIRMRCNDSLEDGVVENFPQIEKQFATFQKLCDHYTAKLQKTVAMALPNIREGKENESSAEELINERNESPFSHENLNKWLRHKEREINIIKSCVDAMEGIKVVPNVSELDREVFAPGVEHALCFIFTSLKGTDPGLRELAIYLDAGSKLEGTKEDPWFYSSEVITKMRKKAKLFSVYAKEQKNNNKVHFFIAAIENEKYIGASMYYYKNGILRNEDFEEVEILDVEAITKREDLIIYACDLTLDPNTAHKEVTLSEGNKRAKSGKSKSYPDHPERFMKHSQVTPTEPLYCPPVFS